MKTSGNLLRKAVQAACFCILISSATASVTTISFGTGSASGWQVTGGGAVNATPYVITQSDVSTGLISLTSNGYGSGTFVSGGSAGNFGGFWTARYNFYLPANATGVSFHYSNFFADDRAVLKLNGNILNATGVPWGQGQMVMTLGGPLLDYSPFTFPNGSASGTAVTGFILGGQNAIELIVNNTYSGVTGPLVGIASDRTDVGLLGTITYTVPEPSSVVLFGVGLLGMIRALRRQN
jgi:hypothetical protein